MKDEKELKFYVGEVPELEWEENSQIKLVQRNKELIEIVANKAGLRSLAKQLLAFADMEEEYSHHYQPALGDSKGGYRYYGDLEEGSVELCISRQEKMD